MTSLSWFERSFPYEDETFEKKKYGKYLKDVSKNFIKHFPYVMSDCNLSGKWENTKASSLALGGEDN